MEIFIFLSIVVNLSKRCKEPELPSGLIKFHPDPL